MANYTFRDHDGLTAGHQRGVEGCAYHVVKYAAANVPWNSAGAMPEGLAGWFERMGKADQETKFTPGFNMEERKGAQQKWEGYATHSGYRLDLQSIDNGWANWAIQTNGKNSKTVASCVMQVDQYFTQGQLVHGLLMSARNTQVCELRP